VREGQRERKRGKKEKEVLGSTGLAGGKISISRRKNGRLLVTEFGKRGKRGGPVIKEGKKKELLCARDARRSEKENGFQSSPLIWEEKRAAEPLLLGIKKPGRVKKKKKLSQRKTRLSSGSKEDSHSAFARKAKNTARTPKNH